MAVAFIPVRGGSKSIPKKNIKLFCGKSLLYWNLVSLQKVESVSEVIVATDSDEIESVAGSFGFNKVRIFRRSSSNAKDNSSTESVMLEYLNSADLDGNEIFMLVQATSPLTTNRDFEAALEMFSRGEYDSLLSCIRTKRFFWNDNGSPVNYDFKYRPRRQDFDGLLMENGAFYINSVANIKRYENRLSGKIGIYEMAEFTGVELDEPDDWNIAESFMRKYILTGEKLGVKLFLTDVDGTLTDSGMYYDQTGNELKKFNTRDGKGFELLREKGIKVGILTSEETGIVKRRAEKLKVDFLVQNVSHGGKLSAAKDICDSLGIPLSSVAYIGDDINCRDILLSVGIPACPSDASVEISSIPGIYKTRSGGGHGAVRDFIDFLLGNSCR